MLYDWVKLMNNPRGEWIENDQIDANLLSIYLRDGEDGVIRFEPIPLTAEILEANGFVLDHGFYIVTNGVGITTMVRYTEQEEEHCHPHFLGHWVLDESYIADNVHELQHALRLCGLTDLANDFKIN